MEIQPASASWRANSMTRRPPKVIPPVKESVPATRTGMTLPLEPHSRWLTVPELVWTGPTELRLGLVRFELQSRASASQLAQPSQPP